MSHPLILVTNKMRREEGLNEAVWKEKGGWACLQMLRRRRCACLYINGLSGGKPVLLDITTYHIRATQAHHMPTIASNMKRVHEFVHDLRHYMAVEEKQSQPARATVLFYILLNKPLF